MHKRRPVSDLKCHHQTWLVLQLATDCSHIHFRRRKPILIFPASTVLCRRLFWRTGCLFWNYFKNYITARRIFLDILQCRKNKTDLSAWPLPWVLDLLEFNPEGNRVNPAISIFIFWGKGGCAIEQWNSFFEMQICQTLRVLVHQ